VQLDAPLLEYLPLGQLLQLPLAVSLYFPLAQVVQLSASSTA
jgi:hypothetical protein